MNYINTQTLQYPISEIEVREEYPNTSFPMPFAAPEPYVYVFPVPPGTYNPLTHRPREIPPELTVKGHWEQRWELLEIPLEEREARALAEAEELSRRNFAIVVSPRQIRQALTKAGLRAQVEAAVANGDQDLKDWWEFATTFERSNPLVINMGLALNVTTEELDNLFVLASTL